LLSGRLINAGMNLPALMALMDLSVPNTHPARSRSEPVLVDDAAEDFVPS
jgi:hypothetical protein